MSPHIRITGRDQEILLGLTQKVRLFTLRQIAGQWWENEITNTRRRLKVLASAGLVRRLSVSARTLPPITKPLITWQPGDAAPDFGRAAHQLQARWDGYLVRPSTAYVATEKAAHLFGGKARGDLKYPLQATHDVGVAAIWLCLRRNAPAWADAWRGEDLLSHTRRGEKLPDAFIVDDDDEPAWIIEFGGSYDASRVRGFHEDCVSRDLPYQLW